MADGGKPKRTWAMAIGLLVLGIVIKLVAAWIWQAS